MAKVKFNQPTASVNVLRFSDLTKNDSFRIATVHSHGAVYRKVVKKSSFGGNEEYMMEEATGELFKPTNSVVELVDVEVSVATPKPSCYR